MCRGWRLGQEGSGGERRLVGSRENGRRVLCRTRVAGGDADSHHGNVLLLHRGRRPRILGVAVTRRGHASVLIGGWHAHPVVLLLLLLIRHVVGIGRRVHLLLLIRRHVLLLHLLMMVMMVLVLPPPRAAAASHINARRATMPSPMMALPSRQMTVAHLAGVGWTDVEAVGFKCFA